LPELTEEQKAKHQKELKLILRESAQQNALFPDEGWRGSGGTHRR